MAPEKASPSLARKSRAVALSSDNFYSESGFGATEVELPAPTTIDDIPTAVLARVVDLAAGENLFLLSEVSRGFQRAVHDHVDNSVVAHFDREFVSAVAIEGKRLLKPRLACCMLGSEGDSYLTNVSGRSDRNACARRSQSTCWWRQRDRLPILDSKVIEPQKAVCDREPLSVSTASIEKKVALELLAGSAWHHVELLE